MSKGDFWCWGSGFGGGRDRFGSVVGLACRCVFSFCRRGASLALAGTPVGDSRGWPSVGDVLGWAHGEAAGAALDRAGGKIDQEPADTASRGGGHEVFLSI